MKAMSEREFSLYRKLIYSNAGICLTPPKKRYWKRALGGACESWAWSHFSTTINVSRPIRPGTNWSSCWTGSQPTRRIF